MKEIDELAKLIEKASSGDGFQQTNISGVYISRHSKPDQNTKREWRACFGVLAQGAKDITLGLETHHLREGDFTASTIHLPIVRRITRATETKPFLALLIDLDPVAIRELAAQLEVLKDGEESTKALFSGRAEKQMMGALVRLAQVAQSPQEARILGPLLKKEIYFRLLTGNHQDLIRKFVNPGTKMQRVAKAIEWIQSKLNQDFDVEALARASNMSQSTFFKSFKEATSMSPIQYQKRLRLLEAKRLLIECGENAESACFKVGYQSASQFSREYKRFFGNPPLRDVKRR